MKMGTDRLLFSRPMVCRSIFAASLMLVVSVAGCSMCTTSVLKRLTSPDGTYTAFVLSNECGATVRDARQVTIVEGSALPKSGWSSAVIEEGTVFRVEGNGEIDVLWTSSSSLTIRYRRQNAKDRIYRQERSWGDVQITFASADGG